MRAPLSCAVALAGFVSVSVTTLGQGRFGVNAGPSLQQPPGIGGAAALSDGVELTAADNFSLRETGPIHTLAWWGLGHPPIPERFSIQVMTENQGLPGTVLASFDSTPNVQRFGSEFRLYSTAVPAPLTAEANTTYWVSIAAPGSRFGWYLGHEGDAWSAFRRGAGGWEPIGFDLALAVNVVPQTVPEPGGWLLAFIGLAALWRPGRRVWFGP